MSRPWEIPEPPEPDGSLLPDLIWLIERQEELLRAVATGSPMANHESTYRERAKKIRKQLSGLGIADPFPWRDLSLFWGRARDYATYQERREWLSDLARPVIEELEKRHEATASVTDWAPTSPPAAWQALERRLDGLKDELARATTLDDRQDVGRRAREVLIDAVNLCYDDSMAVIMQTAVPKGADAKARFDQILFTLTPGRSYEELRKVMRAAWELAQDVTHSEPEHLHALATAQAVVLLVRCLQEIDRVHRSHASTSGSPPNGR